MITTPTINWDKIDTTMQGLLPVIVQDADRLHILMHGYMTAAAWQQTQASGLVTFWSRAKQRLWTKGETSGHTLQLVTAHADCDGDALLILARPTGPTCHQGSVSCFQVPANPRYALLSRLTALLHERLAAAATDAASTSYVVRLLREGPARVAQKVGEEAVETVIAALQHDPTALRSEAADLLFHLLVLLQANGLTMADVLECLEERHAALG